MFRAALLAAAVAAAVSGGISAQAGSIRDRAMTPYRLGFESLRSESWEEAAKLFQDAIDVDPTFEMAHYMLGRAEMYRKNYQKALAAMVRAQGLYQRQAGRQFTSAQDAQRYRRDAMMEIDEAIRLLQSGRQTPQSSEQIRQLNERKRQITQIVDRGNNITLELAVPAYVSLSIGSAYFRTGNLAEAEKAYLAAVASDPKTGEAHSNLAVVYMETGRLNEAEQSVKAAERAGLKVHPDLKAEIARRKKSGSQ